MKRLSPIIILALLSSGCATPYWTLTDRDNRVMTTKSFKVDIPQGWMRETKPSRLQIANPDGKTKYIPVESVAATRDGFGIHAIVVTRYFPDSAFPNIKKTVRPNMLPSEAADLYVSELRKRSGLERLKVLKNKPATVNGKRGFNLLMQYKNDDGLRIKIESFGFVDKSGFYTVMYRAPYLYYFNRDHKDFQRLVQSFRKLKTADS